MQETRKPIISYTCQRASEHVPKPWKYRLAGKGLLTQQPPRAAAAVARPHAHWSPWSHTQGWKAVEAQRAPVLNLLMCTLNAYFLFKSVITDFSSGYLSAYSSLSAFSIPVRDRNSCTFFSNCWFSFTENLPNLIVTPRIGGGGGGRKRHQC